jgi:hypothetical protein
MSEVIESASAVRSIKRTVEVIPAELASDGRSSEQKWTCQESCGRRKGSAHHG